MLQSLINRASDAIHHTISRYVSRVIVSVPVLVAAAFATAAATTELSSRYGATQAYLVLAVVFVVVALIAAAVMSVRENATSGSASTFHSAEDTARTSDATTDPGGPQLKLDPAVLLMAGRLVGPAAAAASARTLLRNWPLVLGVIVLAWLLLSDAPKQEDGSVAEPAE